MTTGLFPSEIKKLELRPYQNDVIEKARASARSGNKRVMIQAATGSGKTEIGIALIKSAVDKGSRVLFLANRKQLVWQAHERLEASGVSCGMVQADNTRDTWRQVLVCSVDTIRARKSDFKVDLVVVDEAHGCTGTKYLRLFELWKDIPIIGLSATPFTRGLGKQFPWGRVFEDMVHAVSIRELIDLGYLVDCDIYAPSAPDLAKIKITAGDYNETELGEAVDQPKLIGDIVETWQKLAGGKPTVCFATNIAHSKHIRESFNRAGITCEHIDCYTDEDERKAILGRVKTGETTVITNVGILTEGWDFPALEVMICARPTKSLTRWLQMAGRILRPYPGKEIALLLDHSGAALDLGHPADDQEFELDDGKPKKAKKEKPKPKKAKKCPKCYFLSTENPCPKCGHLRESVKPVESIDGDLQAYGEKTKATLSDKQAFYSSLLALRGQRAPGWVAHTYRDKFGVWPRGLEERPMFPPVEEAVKFVKHKSIVYRKEQEKYRHRDAGSDGIVANWQLGD